MQGSSTLNNGPKAVIHRHASDYVHSSNYNHDRPSTFRHNNIHNDLIPPGSMSVADYIQNEKAKQLSKLRDWYTEVQNQAEQTDLVELRSNFHSARQFENKRIGSPDQEIRFNPLYLIGAIPVVILLTLMLFVRF